MAAAEPIVYVWSVLHKLIVIERKLFALECNLFALNLDLLDAICFL